MGTSHELKLTAIWDDVVPVKISGWQKESKSGKKFLSLAYSPDYKTLMASREAKEALNWQRRANCSRCCASLAKSTGVWCRQTQQETSSDGHPELSVADAASVDSPEAG